MTQPHLHSTDHQKSINRQLLYDTLSLNSFEAYSYIQENFPLLLDKKMSQSTRNYTEVKCVACFILLKNQEKRGSVPASLLLEALETKFSLGSKAPEKERQ